MNNLTPEQKEILKQAGQIQAAIKWKKTTKKQRSEHAKMMVEARIKKYNQKRRSGDNLVDNTTT